jgi:hypothetical protein
VRDRFAGGLKRFSLPALPPLLQSGRRRTGGNIWLIAFITVSSAGRSASMRGA